MRNKGQLNALKKNFYKGPTNIIKAGLSSSSLLVYFFLTTCSEGFNPSVRYIASSVGLNKNTVCKALKELQSKNIIILHEPAVNGLSAKYEFVSPDRWIDVNQT